MAKSDPFAFARDAFSTSVCDALRNHDFEALETLRDGQVSDHLTDLVAAYAALNDWATKDLVLHLIQDCSDDRVRDVMLDALDSPTPDSRAIAICSLRSDNTLFDGFLVNGFVDGGRVDAAITEYRA
jgi:hypothetical protein